MKLRSRRLFLDNTGAKGFTIVELLIATLVFSVILLIITSGVLAFSRAYYRGANTSSLQNTTRTISEGMSQAIQFSGNTVVTHDSGATPYYVCTGNYVYFYTLYTMYAGGTPIPTNLGVWQQPASNCTTAPVFNATTGTQLLTKNSRVAKFSVSTVPTVVGAWNVDIKLVYGTDDLLSNNGNNANTLCIGKLGDEYCASAELNTIVQQRIQ